MEKPEIILDLLKDGGRYNITIIVPQDKELIGIIRNKLRARWSISRKFWHLPYSKENSHLIKSAFEGKAMFNAEALKLKVAILKKTAERESLKLNYLRLKPKGLVWAESPLKLFRNL
ncbi:MAG: hypothetical protein K2X86_07770, partial [Cytophagaceae bacterium]|nr:hypothetical protein [Cytophagaceae bacterium]